MRMTGLMLLSAAKEASGILADLGSQYPDFDY